VGLPDAGVDLYGIADPARLGERTPTFCLNVGEREPRAVAEELADAGLYVWDGDYYALAPMGALGLTGRGAVRIGFLHYTTPAEVDRTLDALRVAAAP
jgi:selenocysteine lyase/cysteine desulfurase